MKAKHLNDRTALMLDAVGQRYHCRPSSIVGIPSWSGDSVLFDMRVLAIALEHEQQPQTLGDEIKRSRMEWEPEMVNELKERGYGN